MREVVLVAGDGLHECFAWVVAREMEVGAPAVFVEVGGAVVVACGENKGVG